MLEIRHGAQQSLRTDFQFLFLDKALDCPGPLDMMVPRLRPVRASTLGKTVQKAHPYGSCLVYWAEGMGRDIPRRDSGTLIMYVPCRCVHHLPHQPKPQILAIQMLSPEGHGVTAPQ